MSQREKKLAIAFFGILGVFLVVGLGIGVTKAVRGNQSQSLSKRLADMKTVLKSQQDWEQKEEWLEENMPSYSSNTVASTKLIERVEKITSARGLKVEAREILEVDTEEEESQGIYNRFDRTEMAIELSGEMRKIVECIHEIQTPDHFTGVQQMTLDSREGNGIKCRLVISHWYLQ